MLATALPAQLEDQLPIREEFAREMPYLSVVGLRFDIEKALYRLMKLRRIESPSAVGISQALQQPKESGEVPPSGDAFVRALATMNQAVHGLEIEPSAMAEALRSGSEFLALLPQLD
jgi:hypothetical protein